MGSPLAFTGGIKLTFTGGVKKSATVGVPVQVTITGPGRISSVTAVSDGKGNFSADFTPDVAGSWSAQASSPGNSKVPPSESPTCTINVSPAEGSTKIASVLTLSCPSIPTIPFVPPTAFSGLLTPPLGGQTISITYTNVTSSVSVTHQVPTAANGTYTDNFSPFLPSGPNTAQASWPGDAATDGSSSPVCNFMAG